MTKKELYKDVIEASIDVITELKNAGLKDSTIKKPFKFGLDENSWLKEELKLLYKWFKELVVPAHVEVRKIKTLLPDSVWETYNHMGMIEELEEQKQLSTAYKKLRNAWHRYPRFERKKDGVKK
jgi:hypothetical protein